MSASSCLRDHLTEWVPKSLRAGLLRCMHVCFTYFSNRDCATRVGRYFVQVPEIMWSQNAFWLADSQSMSRILCKCLRHEEHTTIPCLWHDLAEIVSDKYLIFFIFWNCVSEPCCRHKMCRNGGAHIGFSSQRWLADMISQRFSHLCSQLED
jgi:hypothetical protein